VLKSLCCHKEWEKQFRNLFALEKQNKTKQQKKIEQRLQMKKKQQQRQRPDEWQCWFIEW